MIHLTRHEWRIGLYDNAFCPTILNDGSLLTEGVELDLIDIRQLQSCLDNFVDVLSGADN